MTRGEGVAAVLDRHDVAGVHGADSEREALDQSLDLSAKGLTGRVRLAAIPVATPVVALLTSTVLRRMPRSALPVDGELKIGDAFQVDLSAVDAASAGTLATHALSIFGDHQDVMACRQTGFAMLVGG